MPIGWQLTERVLELVELGATDRATADRLLRWAGGRAGVDVDVNAAGAEIRWRVRGDEVRHGRGRTLADALDAIEHPPIEPAP